MTKVSRIPLSQESWDKFQSDFWEAVALLKTKAEARNFFKDLLTPTEEKMLAKRLEAAKLLIAGKSYDAIRKELRLGNSAIANVHNWLDEGTGGLKFIAKRLSKKAAGGSK